MSEIILASASPRRKELLSLAGISFTVKTAPTDEILEEGVLPEDAVKILAKRKAAAVWALNSENTVIGADTVVAIDGKILGKPKTFEEAYAMLSLLSGRTHSVYTGVYIIGKEKEICFSEKTEVEFFDLTKEEIEAYIKTGDCYDKAGAYGIQSKGCVLVKKINGDYFNVVGLPIAKTYRQLQSF